MEKNNDERPDLKLEQILVSPMSPQQRIYSNNDAIEVIDLDNPRNQIKPTTWHRS